MEVLLGSGMLRGLTIDLLGFCCIYLRQLQNRLMRIPSTLDKYFLQFWISEIHSQSAGQPSLRSLCHGYFYYFCFSGQTENISSILFVALEDTTHIIRAASSLSYYSELLPNNSTITIALEGKGFHM